MAIVPTRPPGIVTGNVSTLPPGATANCGLIGTLYGAVSPLTTSRNVLLPAAHDAAVRGASAMCPTGS